MNRPTLAATTAASLLAAVSSASAQGPSLDINVDSGGSGIIPGSVLSITMAAGYDPADYAVAGIATDILASAPRDLSGAWSDPTLVAPMDGPGTFAGTPAGSGVGGILAGQLNFPPAGIYADDSNPIVFWEATFTVPADQPGGYAVDLTTMTSRFDVYVARDRSTSESRVDVLTEGRGRFLVVPAPASAAVLGIGFVLTTRRRR